MFKILKEICWNSSRDMKIKFLTKIDRYLWCRCYGCRYHLSDALISAGQIQIHLQMHPWLATICLSLLFLHWSLLIIKSHFPPDSINLSPSPASLSRLILLSQDHQHSAINWCQGDVLSCGVLRSPLYFCIWVPNQMAALWHRTPFPSLIQRIAGRALNQYPEW